MTDKRFTIVDTQFISYYGGNGHKISNGECAFWLWHSEKESQKVCDKLNNILDENEQLTEFAQHNYSESKKIISNLQKENERLKKQLKSIEDGFKFSCTENHTEFDKDKLIVKDTHTKIHLDGRNLFIEVYIPQIDEFYRFKYTITGKSLMREFIENYNPKGDLE